MKLLVVFLAAFSFLVACGPDRHRSKRRPPSLLLELATPAPVSCPLGSSVPISVHTAPYVSVVFWWPGARQGMVVAGADANGIATARIARGPQTVSVGVWTDPWGREAEPVYFELDGT